jgi:hypothetical protein
MSRDICDRKDLAIPWKAIFTSLPVWGIVLGHASSNWGNYTLNQQLPTYLTDVLRFDLSLTGLLSSLCYVLQWIGRPHSHGHGVDNEVSVSMGHGKKKTRTNLPLHMYYLSSVDGLGKEVTI